MTHYIETCSPAAAPRSRNPDLAAILARFITLMKRHRQARESTAILSTYNDHMLADIGLRRDRMAPRLDDSGWFAQDGLSRIRRF